MSKPPPSWFKRGKRRLVTALATAAGPWILRLLARTWRVRRWNEEVWDLPKQGRPLPVFCLWHGNIPAGVALHRNMGLAVMISRHRDGEIVSRIVERLGFQTARGSSTTGGMAATREMLRFARDARGLVMVPDGPRGPARMVAPGTLWLAAASGRMVVPTAFVADRAWRTRSWDSMMIPKPFARVGVHYGAPLEVPRATLRAERGLEEQAALLKAEFERGEEQARQAMLQWSGGR